MNIDWPCIAVYNKSCKLWFIYDRNKKFLTWIEI